MPSLLTRIAALTDRSGGQGACWRFQGFIDKDGYGRIYLDRETGSTGAHRAAYVAHVGNIPPGMQVDHRCFNTACVNPAHLRLLTREANEVRQRKSFRTHCLNGHEYTAANTRRPPNGTGRVCRACDRDAARRYRVKKSGARA